jgi:hypothetical protein
LLDSSRTLHNERAATAFSHGTRAQATTTDGNLDCLVNKFCFDLIRTLFIKLQLTLGEASWLTGRSFRQSRAQPRGAP